MASLQQAGGASPSGGSNNFPFGVDAGTKKPVTIPLLDRFRGTYMLGLAGTGKSTLLLSHIVQDIRDGYGVCVIDPHGSLVQDTLSYVPPNRERDIVLLDPLDKEYSIGLNFFDVPDAANIEATQLAVEYIGQVFGKLFTPSGDLMQDAPNLARTLRNSTYTLLDNYSMYRTTLAEIPLLIDSKEARRKLLANVSPRNSLARSFWEQYDAMEKQSDRLALTSSTASRLEPFLQNPFIRDVVSQSTSTVNFRQLMDQSKIVLVPLPRQYEDLSTLLGSLLISKIIQAAFSRVSQPEALRKPFFLYIDELGLFSSPALASMIATLFSESRKFKLGITACHQWRNQLDKATRDATLNAGSLVVFSINGEDAEEMSKAFQVSNVVDPTQDGVVSNQVLQVILTDGHPDESVQSWIKAYGRRLQSARGSEDEKVSLGRGDSMTLPPVIKVTSARFPAGISLEYSYSPDEIKKCMVELSDWMAHLIRHPDLPIDEPGASIMRPIASVLCFLNVYTYATIGAANDRLLGMLTEKLAANTPLPGGKNPSLGVYHAAFQVACSMALDEKLKRQTGPRLYQENDFVVDPAPPRTEHERIALVTEIFTMEAKNYQAFISSLHLTMRALRKQPVLSDGRKFGLSVSANPRLISDLKQELAQILANLPKYTARAKLNNTEYTIQALPLGTPTGDSEAIRERVRRNTILAGHLRKRSDIQSEIEQRQSRLLGTGGLSSLSTSVVPFGHTSLLPPSQSSSLLPSVRDGLSSHPLSPRDFTPHVTIEEVENEPAIPQVKWRPEIAARIARLSVINGHEYRPIPAYGKYRVRQQPGTPAAAKPATPAPKAKPKSPGTQNTPAKNQSPKQPERKKRSKQSDDEEEES